MTELVVGVTVLAHRRAGYLRQTLDALAKCNRVSGWRITIVLDRPDALTRDCVDCMACAGWEVATLDLRNRADPPYSRISRATLLALSLGFVTADYVVHLEEDCVPAPDLLTWHAAMAERYRDDKRVFTVSAWSGAPGIRHADDHLAPFFTPWGWGTWRDRFDEMRADWDLSGGQWDVRVNEVLRGSRMGVFPAVSLVRNIGRIGTQPEAEWLAREQVGVVTRGGTKAIA